jgi:catechol 2,3-dioxygenase-like lactoylglutathione lyase family enzyme
MYFIPRRRAIAARQPGTEEVAMEPTTAPLALTSCYPVLFSPDPAAAARFYLDDLGFAPSFEADWYVSLRHPETDHELALLDATHETIPAAFRGRTSSLLLNFEVADADAVVARLLAKGHEIALPLRDEPFGQRHAIFVGPDGVLIDIIQPIPPAPEFAAAFG